LKRTHLDLGAACLRPLSGERQGRIEVGRLDDPEAAEALLRLQVGPSVKAGFSPCPSMVVAVVAGSRPSAKAK